MLIVLDKGVPFVIFGYCNWSGTKSLHCIISFISLPFDDARICVVGFLDLSNNNGLQLSARTLKVEESLIEKLAVVQTNE